MDRQGGRCLSSRAYLWNPERRHGKHQGIYSRTGLLVVHHATASVGLVKRGKLECLRAVFNWRYSGGDCRRSHSVAGLGHSASQASRPNAKMVLLCPRLRSSGWADVPSGAFPRTLRRAGICLLSEIPRSFLRQRLYKSGDAQGSNPVSERIAVAARSPDQR